MCHPVPIPTPLPIPIPIPIPISLPLANSANALCAAFAYDNPQLLGSRLFLYYNERAMEGDISDDAGACLSDGVQALHTQGLCPETMWPYSDDKVGSK